jgi:hypothetical protein
MVADALPRHGATSGLPCFSGLGLTAQTLRQTVNAGGMACAGNRMNLQDKKRPATANRAG